MSTAAHARGAALAAKRRYAARGPLGNPVRRWEALGRPYEAARARAALRAGSLATSPREQARRAEAGATLLAAQAIPRLQQVGDKGSIAKGCLPGVPLRFQLASMRRTTPSPARTGPSSTMCWR